MQPTSYKCKIKSNCKRRELTRLSTYLVPGPTYQPLCSLESLQILKNLHRLFLREGVLIYLFRCGKTPPLLFLKKRLTRRAFTCMNNKVEDPIQPGKLVQLSKHFK